MRPAVLPKWWIDHAPTEGDTGGGGGGGGSSKIPAGGNRIVVATSVAPKIDLSYQPPPAQTNTETSTSTGTNTTPTTTTPTTTTPTTTTSTTSPLSFGKVAQGADGTLTVTLTVPAAGVLEGLASYPKKGGKAAALKLGKGQLLYSKAKKPVAAAGTVKLKLKPTKAAKKTLAKRKLLRVKIITRLTPKTGSPSTKTKTVTVRVKKKSTRAAGRAART